MTRLWLIIAALDLSGLIAAIVLLVRGKRGRVIDDHPLCVNCGFDLIGLPPGVKTCSECGVNVGIPRAIRIGHRQRRLKLIVAGALLLVPVVLVAAVSITSVFGTFQWIQYEPLWSLRRQAMRNSGSSAGAEILRRIRLGELSDGQLGSLIDEVLDIQADPKQTWNPQWGDWVQLARTTGKLSEEQWGQYMRGAAVVRVTARAKIRRGEELPLLLEVLPSRVGSGQQVSVSVGTVLPESSVALPSGSRGWLRMNLVSGGPVHKSTTSLQLNRERVAALINGPQVLPMRLTLEFSEGAGAAFLRGGPTLAKREIELELPWTLMPADAVTIDAIDDAARRPAMEAAVSLGRVYWSETAQRRSISSDSKVNLSVHFKNLPIPLACQVVAWSGNKEWKFSTIVLPVGTTTGWGFQYPLEGFRGDRVNVTLRPSREAAMESVTLQEYWNVPIEFRDVKIEDGPPVTTQSSSPAPPKASPTNPGAPAKGAR